MSKFDELNSEMSTHDAEQYLSEIYEDLEKIYLLGEAPAGKAGTVWRTIWGRPRRLTPMAYFLGLKLQEEIDSNQQLLKENSQKVKTKTERKYKQTIEQLQLKNSNTEAKTELLLDENDDLRSKLDRARKEREIIQKDLRQYKVRENAEKHPKMIDALTNDVTMLLERLKKHEDIDFKELQYHRLLRGPEHD